jgi:putative NADH-flavin reductase
MGFGLFGSGGTESRVNSETNTNTSTVTSTVNTDSRVASQGDVIQSGGGALTIETGGAAAFDLLGGAINALAGAGAQASSQASHAQELLATAKAPASDRTLLLGGVAVLIVLAVVLSRRK